MYSLRRFALSLLLPLVVRAGIDVDVRSCGAAGDGRTLDTAAIQQAIDACATQGGGRVVFPAGRYLSGSLQLRSRVVLVVTTQATLVGSSSVSNYPTTRLLGATDAADIGIEGGGVIDGQGPAFWEPRNDYRGPEWRKTAQFDYRALKRPGFLHFTRCTNVTLRDVTFSNSPSWTVHLQRCVSATVERVTIRNPLHGPNTDGIDVNSCRHVRIRDCDIITGDDGVVLKSNEPGHDHPSVDIAVERCRIWSACNALKIGTETHDDFTHIRFRDCELYCGSDRMMDRPLAGLAIESVDGSRLTDVVAENLVMRNVRAPIFVRLGHRGGNSPRTRQVEPRVPGAIQGVVLRNIKAEQAAFESSITGLAGHPVGDVTLENISLAYQGGIPADAIPDEVPDAEVVTQYPEAQMFGRLPAYGLYARHVASLKLSSVVFRTQAADARSALMCDDVAKAEFDAVNVAAAPAKGPVLRFLGGGTATLRRCSAPVGTAVFVAHETDGAGAVTLMDCDTRAAATAMAKLRPDELTDTDLPVFEADARGVVSMPPASFRLTAPMVSVGDDPTLGRIAIEVPRGGGRETGTARARFTVSSAGDYVLWVHALAPSGESDSFHLRIDREVPVLSDLAKTGAWALDRVRDRNAAGQPSLKSFKTFHLTAGTHTLTIRNRESGVRFDRVWVVPVGLAFPPE